MCRPNQNLPAGALCKYFGVWIVRLSGAHPTNFVPMYWIVSSRWPAESILVQGNNYARMKYLLLGLYLKPISHLDKKQRNRRKPYRLDPFNKTIITIADGRVAIRSSFHLVCPVLTVHILASVFLRRLCQSKDAMGSLKPASVLCSWDNKRPAHTEERR